MYETSMKGIEQLLMSKSEKQGLVYTHELGPQRGQDGAPYVARRVPSTGVR